MQDYMRTLQKQFETKSEFLLELDADIRKLHRNISSRLEKENRELLLALVDMEDFFRSEATLHSFICGYCLACGIRRELEEHEIQTINHTEDLLVWKRMIPEEISGTNIEALNKE